MSCLEYRPYLQAFVDNELSPERAIDIEQHIGGCQECEAEVEISRSLCCATRKMVGGDRICSQFQARLGSLLSDERKREEVRAARPAALTGALPWRAIVPLAAAAVMALFFGMSDRVVSRDLAPASMQNHVVDFMVQNHASAFEPEMRERSAVSLMEGRLGFPVRAPNLERYGARFEGANLVPVNQTQVAMLHYRMGGRRMTLYMYDPEKLPLRAQQALQPRAVRDRAVFVGRRSGYAIAACEQQGIGYAVTGDFSGDESAELVAAIHR